MWEKFSKDAVQAEIAASRIAEELPVLRVHDDSSGRRLLRFIVPVHLVYGLADVGDPTGGQPLRDSGLTVDVLRRFLAEQEDRRDPDVPASSVLSPPDYPSSTEDVRFALPYADSTMEAFNLAVDGAAHDALNELVRPGHLLLAVLSLGDRLVTELLIETQVDAGTLSAAARTQLSTSPPDPGRFP